MASRSTRSCAARNIQHKDGTIKSADIKNGTIKHDDVKTRPSRAIGWRKRFAASSTREARRTTAGSPGPAGAPGAQAPRRDALTVVTAPGGGWSASPGLTQFTPNGVVFGPFTDSDAEFGGVRFEGADVVGQPVRDIAELTYSAGFNGTSDEPPYLRILTDVNGDGFNFDDCCEPGLDDHEFLFSPASRPAPGSVGTAAG